MPQQKNSSTDQSSSSSGCCLSPVVFWHARGSNSIQCFRACPSKYLTDMQMRRGSHSVNREINCDLLWWFYCALLKLLGDGDPRAWGAMLGNKLSPKLIYWAIKWRRRKRPRHDQMCVMMITTRLFIGAPYRITWSWAVDGNFFNLLCMSRSRTESQKNRSVFSLSSWTGAPHNLITRI